VPLVRSFWLSTKKGKEAWVEPIIDRQNNSYRFEVRVGKPPDGFDPGIGTIGRKGGRCIISGSPMAFTHVRAEGKCGRMGQHLMAIVAEGARGRVYLLPVAAHAKIAESARPSWRPDCLLPVKHRNFQTPAYGMPNVGDLFTPRQLTTLTTFSDLVKEVREKVLVDAKAANPKIRGSGFQPDSRQTPGPTSQPDTQAAIVGQDGQPPEGNGSSVGQDSQPPGGLPLSQGGTGPQAYADAVATYLAFAVDKAANIWSALCSWMSDRGALRETFARQAIPMVWDFAEASPFSGSCGNFSMFIDRISDAISHTPALLLSLGAAAFQRSAETGANGVPHIICTDPPYYDNIGYADLSDFFYVWLRRSLGDIYPELFNTLLTPKAEELIASPYRHGGKEKAQEFFENGLGKVFENIRKVQPVEFPMTVFYAFKQTEGTEAELGGGHPGRQKEQAGETHAPQTSSNLHGETADPQSQHVSTGWETMLSGLIDSGFAITGTWPMRTELGNRMVGAGTNALASSIVLSCRPRPADAPVATRREFLAALKKELPDALRHLQAGNIAPVDLAQASIGPGMAIFTHYAKVMEADGSAMGVRAALGLINQLLDEILAQQEGEFDADTRWALAWFEQFGMEDGPFGEAETLSRAKNTAVNGLVEAGIITARSGKVRLLKRSELPSDWSPATDKRLVHWEIAQHLIRALENGGETVAANILRQLGSNGELARDLAYRLYNLCDRKKWAQEALAYNSLIIAWPEISKLARKTPGTSQTQEEMFR
jgi:putative DNA methylase